MYAIRSVLQLLSVPFTIGIHTASTRLAPNAGTEADAEAVINLPLTHQEISIRGRNAAKAF